MNNKIIRIITLVVSVTFICAHSVLADVNELLDLPLEDLLNIKVTSATGREQKQKEVSNAMYVITSEDIARSGAKNLPDLFFRVPGMQVRKVDGHRYEVAIRDVAGILTVNLLVLVDGAVVFNPGLSGTFWQYLPVALDDIDRIEIIRGPGGVLYSSNAVRGVINIYTKSAKSQDNFVSLRGGNMAFGQSTLNFSETTKDGKVSIGGNYQFTTDEGLRRRERQSALNDDLTRQIVNLRTLVEISDSTSLKFTANHSNNNIVNQGDVAAGGSYKQYGGITSFIARIDHQVNDNYDLFFHLDQTEHRISLRSPSDVEVYTTNARVQNNIKYELAGEHVLSLGGEWTFNQFKTEEANSPNPEDTQKIISFFVQNEYRPTDKWIFTGSLRTDDNNYVQPREVLLSPRFSMMYALTESSNIRAVATRAYRTNSFLERQGSIPFGTIPIRITGNLTTDPEEDTTYELGYRTSLFDNKLNVETDVFYSKLKDVIVLGDLNYATFSVPLQNKGDLRAKGAELLVRYAFNSNWNMNFDYSYIQPNPDPDTINATTRDRSVSISKHLIGAGIQYAKNNFTFDIYAKYIDEFNSLSTLQTDVFVEDYVRTFMRMAKKFKLPKSLNSNDAEVELVANDIFDPRDFATRDKIYIRPEVYLGFKTWF